MNNNLITWALIIVTVLLIMAVFAISHAIKGLTASKYYKDKVKKASEFKSLIILGFALLLPELLHALSPEVSDSTVTLEWWQLSFNELEIWIIFIFDLLLFSIVLHLIAQLNSLIKLSKLPEAKSTEPSELAVISHILTDAIPIEQEKSILFDHEYDGIRELDNNLPPWWKWGFYLSIVFAFGYILHFHVLGTGTLQIASYEAEIAEAEKDVAEYLKKSALNVDENSVIILTEASDISKGKKIFMDYCTVCHKEYGQGNIGPNLTDDYWIYGNKIEDLFKTIKYGAKNGMQSWQAELNPVQMQQVASFILTLRGKSPEKGKDPQGDYYGSTETETIDISEEVKDSTLNVENGDTTVDESSKP